MKKHKFDILKAFVFLKTTKRFFGGSPWRSIDSPLWLQSSITTDVSLRIAFLPFNLHLTNVHLFSAVMEFKPLKKAVKVGKSFGEVAQRVTILAVQALPPEFDSSNP